MAEFDKTFFGQQYKRPRKPRGGAHKNKLLTLVDCTTGQAKSIVVKGLKKSALYPILRENVAQDATVYTDEAQYYKRVGPNKRLGPKFAHYDFTTHSAGEYVHGDVRTNTMEGFFSIFKRGIMGVYQHCNKKHLHRYAAEFEFRYSNRIANGTGNRVRADIVPQSISGKRPTYRGAGVRQ